MSSDLLTPRVVLPSDPGWELARRAWNLAVDQRPAAVALPESVDDVRAIVELARARDLRIAPQGTGHGALSLGSLDDTILLNTSRMRTVRIDAGARSARIAAGVVWGELAAAAAEHGLAGLAGSSPTVGVVGYSIGGGLGWLARRYGLAAGSIISAEVVTADGRQVRADRDHEPDLLWALRGGGSCAIITALELTLHPLREIYGGAMFWPITRAREILPAWRAWIDGLPGEVTSVARLRKMPSRPHIPERLRGRTFAIVEAACPGSEPACGELLDPLRVLGPEIDTFAMLPMTELGRIHMDPPEPMPRIGDGILLAELPEAAIHTLVAAFDSPACPIGSVEVRQLGGALARQSTAPGALTSLDARFAVYAVGMATTPQAAALVEREIAMLLDALTQWQAAGGYPNFAERHADASDLYPPATLDRLRRIKTRYDPDNVISSNHPIAPLSGSPDADRGDPRGRRLAVVADARVPAAPGGLERDELPDSSGGRR